MVPGAGSCVSPASGPFVDNLRLGCMHARLVGRRLLPFPHRKLVASAEAHLDPRALLHPIRMLKGLLKESATPGLLAVSAGVGTFLAALPLISVHTLVILYVATRLQLNKVMAVSIQNLCMPPFVPMICIEVGYRMRYGRWLTDFSPTVIFGELHHRLFEWLLGSLVVAPVAAVLVGGVVFLGAWAAADRSRKAQGPCTGLRRRGKPGREKRGNELGLWFFMVFLRLFGLRGAYGLLYIVCLYYVIFGRLSALPRRCRTSAGDFRAAAFWGSACMRTGCS